MLRRIALFGTVAAVFGGLIATPAHAQTPIDPTNHTVTCDTLNKGTAQFKPSLVLGGTLATATKIKGTLTGCTATPNDITVISGSVSGLLSSPTNDCLSLLGPSATAGTITIKWKTVEKLTTGVTTITVGAGDVSGGTLTPFGDAATYGLFNISGTTQTGAFGGVSGTGTGSFTKSLTTQGVAALTPACSSLKGLKAVNLGSTEVTLQ
jgi:hypothetical protein